jgi:hypothetical protein
MERGGSHCRQLGEDMLPAFVSAKVRQLEIM